MRINTHNMETGEREADDSHVQQQKGVIYSRGQHQGKQPTCISSSRLAHQRNNVCLWHSRTYVSCDRKELHHIHHDRPIMS